MLTPRCLLVLLRIVAFASAVGLAILMLGPYQGLEIEFGLSDKPAHAIAAFFVAQGLFLVAPRWRRLDLALIVLLSGAVIEVAQALTGRSMSLSDFAADVLGIAVALMPGAIEQLRRHVRQSPDVAFANIRKGDRRQSRKRRPRAYSAAGGGSPRAQNTAR